VRDGGGGGDEGEADCGLRFIVTGTVFGGCGGGVDGDGIILVGRLKSKLLCRFGNEIVDLALILLARFVDFCRRIVSSSVARGCGGGDLGYKLSGNCSSNAKLQKKIMSKTF
jgi:hypothetical protein